MLSAFYLEARLCFSEPPVFVVDLSQVIQLSSTHSVGEEILKLKAMDGDEWVANSTKIRCSNDARNDTVN